MDLPLTKNFFHKNEIVGFRFKGEHQEQIVGVYSTGWEIICSPSYNWYGMTRTEVGKFVFQYTLSGQGMIDIQGKTYPLPSGNAFFVELPSEHRYYFPPDGSHWEFIHITLFGEEFRKAYYFITERMGHVISFPADSDVIKTLFSIYHEASEKKITDSYQSSALGYKFMMELYRFAKNIGTPEQLWPEPIMKAALYAQKHYNQPIGLDDLVEASGLSKYHFTRLFKKVTNMTPLHYLTKIRIDKAITYLRTTDFTIEEIAKRVGYANGNYFNKVFHKWVGMPPGQFRESKYAMPVDYILID